MAILTHLSAQRRAVETVILKFMIQKHATLRAQAWLFEMSLERRPGRMMYMMTVERRSTRQRLATSTMAALFLLR